ncbi:hypothetical protein DSCO28_53900 [Desulfosarcina ovata subsp. sediminis]|uniref:Uncharacterized protein n=1 Tax=Desulfosarcina ovata subsp. sediminis TaxID=885957 RepID=A0A5K7ZXB6_9BACT|nr:hypothetical protein DSCO28_53900 [Desulfosarcina ovata subsp. sediminis]
MRIAQLPEAETCVYKKLGMHNNSIPEQFQFGKIQLYYVKDDRITLSKLLRNFDTITSLNITSRYFYISKWQAWLGCVDCSQ